MFVIALDGVLRTTLGTPIPDGVRLYHALMNAGARLVVASDVSEAAAAHWMRSNGLPMPDDIIGDEVAMATFDLRSRQVEVLRPGTVFMVVIEPDPERALTLIEDGVSVMLFAAQKFVDPKHRLTRARTKSWSDLVTELEQRQDSVASSFE